jgi:hypothetical protein
MSRDKKLDDEAKRLKSVADNSGTPSSKAMLEGFSRFYESMAEDESGEAGGGNNRRRASAVEADGEVDAHKAPGEQKKLEGKVRSHRPPPE